MNSKIKVIAVPWVIPLILLGIYIGYYLHLRSTKYLIHRYTIGDGNKIVAGDVNAMTFLLSKNPEAAAREFIIIQNITSVFYYPMIMIEEKYHDKYYVYNPIDGL